MALEIALGNIHIRAFTTSHQRVEFTPVIMHTILSTANNDNVVSLRNSIFSGINR